MHLGASPPNLREGGRNLSNTILCKICEIHKNLCYYDIHTCISFLWFIPKSTNKHDILTIVRLLCIYFDQIISLFFCHHAYRDRSELIFVKDNVFEDFL